MESVKTLVQRFLRSLVSSSQTTINRPIPSEEPRTEQATNPPSLDGLNLSPRVFNCLWNADIRYIEAAASMTDERLLNIRGFGVKALAELKERLASYNPSDGSTGRP